MWQALRIAEQNYFFQCSATESSIRYSLYNLKEIWSEECSITDALQRAKALNKRVCYDSKTVMKTLQTNIPASSTLDDSEGDAGSRMLVLKYQLGRPFNFEWILKPLPIEDFKELVTYPLFMSIHYLSEQITELKDIIKKKDIEIKQYKEEGAVLKRSTVGTVAFDEDAFNERYEAINNLAKGFVNISEELKSCFPSIEIKTHKTSTASKPSETSTSASHEKLKRSPMKIKARKRVFFERNRKRLENLLKVKKEAMEYLSSQSQTPPMDELAEIIQSLDELDAKRLASTTL